MQTFAFFGRRSELSRNSHCLDPTRWTSYSATICSAARLYTANT